MNIKNMPKAYLLRYVEFYKLKFKVTPDVLIPRPETELLVDEVLQEVKSAKGKVQSQKDSALILDLGTGTGNIAIALACNLKGYNINIIATDVSKKALKVAKQNAKLHGVESNIEFVISNLLENIASEPDVIVTNLPYIPSSRIPYLDSSVKDFEPLMALDGGEDGFGLYIKLFQQISQQPRGLQPKLIVCEIDYTHGELAMSEAQKYFPEYQVEVKTDLAHKQRILKIHALAKSS